MANLYYSFMANFLIAKGHVKQIAVFVVADW